MEPLDTYVSAWHESADNVLELATTFGPEEWATPTDLPGWTVHDVVAHLAHIEGELASGNRGGSAEGSEIPSAYTEAGVDARRERTADQLVEELDSGVRVRFEQLQELPDDASTPAPVTPDGINWTWDTLLRNRAIDMWTHEQDIRRAVDRPGGMDGFGAQVTTQTFKAAMAFVVGKRVRPEPGTCIALRVTGPAAFELDIVVGEDGRAKAAEGHAGGADTAITMDTESFAALAAGRLTALDVEIDISGDRILASKLLSSIAVTP